MPGLFLSSARSMRPMMLVVMVILVGAMALRLVSAHAAPMPSSSLEADTLMGVLFRLADAVEDLVMRIQDEFEGWTIT